MDEILHRPRRSVLYVPGSNEKALSKLASLEADAVIYDLEDAVVPILKDHARSIIIDLVNSNQHHKKEQIVRINSDENEYGKKDYEILEKCEPDAILIPKVNHRDDILKYVPYLKNKKTMLWAMMETPHAIINAYDIAACSEKLNCFVMGTNDLSKELDLNDLMRRTGLETSILTCLIATKANKLSIIDGVFNAFKDAAGFEEECRYGNGLGLDGKTLIHPSQIEPCNRNYSPSDEQIAQAEKMVTAYENARKENPEVGVIVIDGKQIEELHVIHARKLLAFKALLGK
jgi:citrate lyase subunit beta/citryl-CoA lyase|tara:strand:- start:12502 stop:13365 length:864 start_codon:yes stop_codon:yes gene_type:complete